MKQRCIDVTGVDITLFRRRLTMKCPLGHLSKYATSSLESDVLKVIFLESIYIVIKNTVSKIYYYSVLEMQGSFKIGVSKKQIFSENIYEELVANNYFLVFILETLEK